MSSLDKKRLDRLYNLMAQAANEDDAAALRWAIFLLEQYLK